MLPQLGHKSFLRIVRLPTAAGSAPSKNYCITVFLYCTEYFVGWNSQNSTPYSLKGLSCRLLGASLLGLRYQTWWLTVPSLRWFYWRRARCHLAPGKGGSELGSFKGLRQAEPSQRNYSPRSAGVRPGEARGWYCETEDQWFWLEGLRLFS